MKRDLVRTIINTKLEIMQEVVKHLPAEVAEPMERQGYEFIKDLNEVLTEYLENKKMPAQKAGGIKNVPVE